MNILLIEPFFGGSHRIWANGWKKRSRHNIELWTLPGRHWKWRMHGAAVHFAEKYNQIDKKPDIIVTTDFLDVAVFKGLATLSKPVIVYFHENQLAYPWSGDDPDVKDYRDRRYMWINFTSALSADALWFNSAYNQDSFLSALPRFLEVFPDKILYDKAELEKKSRVVPVGIDLDSLQNSNPFRNEVPVILWNHRWEYDKGPDLFFETLIDLAESGYDFRLIVAGQKKNKYPPIFDKAHHVLKKKIIHFGTFDKMLTYYEWMRKASIIPVTATQDFFGISVVEAIACGLTPLLPLGLAYTEHLSVEKYPNLFYRTPEEFKYKLIKIMESSSTYQLRKYVEKYDWKTIITLYDESILDVYKNFQKN